MDEGSAPTRRSGCLPHCLLQFGVLLFLAATFVPRGVLVTIHNATDRELDLRIEAGSDVAFVRGVEPGTSGSAELAPRHDTSILVDFYYRDRKWPLDLNVYTFSDATGWAEATIQAEFRGNAPPQLVDVDDDSGYTPWSIFPASRESRAFGQGLAVGLVLAALVAFRARRDRSREATV